MKQYMINNSALILALILISTTLTSCEAIAGIFKAGMWVGVIGVILVVVLILYFVGKGRR